MFFSTNNYDKLDWKSRSLKLQLALLRSQLEAFQYTHKMTNKVLQYRRYGNEYNFVIPLYDHTQKKMCKIKPTKPKIPNQTNQTEPTKPNQNSDFRFFWDTSVALICVCPSLTRNPINSGVCFSNIVTARG